MATVQGNLDGANDEIDVSATNQERLRDKLVKFLEVATRSGRHAGLAARVPDGGWRRVPPGREQTQAVSDWATGTGYEISSRARIRKNIQEAFDQAH